MRCWASNAIPNPHHTIIHPLFRILKGFKHRTKSLWANYQVLSNMISFTMNSVISSIVCNKVKGGNGQKFAVTSSYAIISIPNPALVLIISERFCSTLRSIQSTRPFDELSSPFTNLCLKRATRMQSRNKCYTLFRPPAGTTCRVMQGRILLRASVFIFVLILIILGTLSSTTWRMKQSLTVL